MALSLVQLLQTMVQNHGSDLHIATNSSPMIRIRGEMVKLNVPVMTGAEVEAMAGQITNQEQKLELANEKSIDFSFKATGVGIFRVNLFTQRHGMSIVLRILTENPPTLDELKMPEICKIACSFANGLVLVTGPTGSGKSTTLAAMLNYINMTTKGHILTLEDPIEFQHESKTCMVNQRSLGQHFTSFASAMRAALREDPDVILVGEMRDPETIALALKAAETGHLVFSTLHTNSAIKTVDRIINAFAGPEQAQIRAVLAETLKVVVAQKLVPSADRQRRICIPEILVNNTAAANLIREGKTFQLTSVMQTAKREGMIVGDQLMLEYVRSGEILGEDAWEAANEKALFSQWAPKVGMGVAGPQGAPAPAAGGAAGAPGAPAGSSPVKKVA